MFSDEVQLQALKKAKSSTAGSVKGFPREESQVSLRNELANDGRASESAFEVTPKRQTRLDLPSF